MGFSCPFIAAFILYTLFSPGQALTSNSTHTVITLNVDGMDRQIVVPNEFAEGLTQFVQNLIEEIQNIPNTSVLIDVNECKTPNASNCDPITQDCVDIISSHECICKQNFIELDNNTNKKCVYNTCMHNPCGNGNCTVEADGYSCECDEGYNEGTAEEEEMSGSGNGSGDGSTYLTCVANNCTEDSCDTNAQCSVMSGSVVCTCNERYTGDGTTCTDIDECALNTDMCDDNANCVNTNGNYTCTCVDGYTGDGEDCKDIDECTSDTDDCDDLATCANTDGAYNCTCPEGYSGNGNDCGDINECDGENNCHKYATCGNEEGSFTCTCNIGFSGDGVGCADMNECETGDNDCHDNANCSNTVGSFTCVCKDGYSGDGVSCLDVNECEAGDPCENYECFNTEGSYECRCGEGFTKAPFSGTCLSETSIPAKISGRKASARRKRDGDECAEALEDALQTFLLYAGIDANITVHIVAETDSETTRTFDLRIEADPEIEIALGSALESLMGTTICGTEVTDVSYPKTVNFEGETDLTNTTTFCDQIQTAIETAIDASSLNTSDTAIECTIDESGIFNITLTETFADLVDVDAIIATITESDSETFGVITDLNECDDNPCHEHATCTNLIGSYKCECMNAYHDADVLNPGTNCVPPHKFTCGADNILVESYLGYFSRIDADPSNLHLLTKTCTGNEVGAFLVFDIGLHDCGTEETLNETENLVTFSNKVTNIHNGIQAHNPALEFSFECSYSTDFTTGNDTLPPEIQIIGQVEIITKLTDSGSLTVTLETYQDIEFENPVTTLSNITVGDSIYVEATQSAEASSIYMKLTRCWTTPSEAIDDPTQDDLINAGCPVDTSVVTIINNGDAAKAKFEYVVSRFTDSDYIYIHCDVALCDTECVNTCSKRRRRESGGSEHTATMGPFRISEEETPDLSASETVNGGEGINLAGVIAGVCVLAVTVFIIGFLVIRKSRQRASSARNEEYSMAPRSEDYDEQSHQSHRNQGYREE